jgi:hypothetical protein
VIETIGSHYCRHWSSAGLTRYVLLKVPKALEEWVCRQARGHRKVALGGRTIQATIGAMVSHSMFLNGNTDDDNNCEVGMTNISTGRQW